MKKGLKTESCNESPATFRLPVNIENCGLLFWVQCEKRRKRWSKLSTSLIEDTFCDCFFTPEKNATRYKSGFVLRNLMNTNYHFFPKAQSMVHTASYLRIHLCIHLLTIERELNKAGSTRRVVDLHGFHDLFIFFEFFFEEFFIIWSCRSKPELNPNSTSKTWPKHKRAQTVLYTKGFYPRPH